jgi:hypothetical protein
MHIWVGHRDKSAAQPQSFTDAPAGALASTSVVSVTLVDVHLKVPDGSEYAFTVAFFGPA